MNERTNQDIPVPRTYMEGMHDASLGPRPVPVRHCIILDESRGDPARAKPTLNDVIGQ